MKSEYLKYVDDCSIKGEEPLTEQQYDFCTNQDWFTYNGIVKKATKEQSIDMYTKCIREDPLGDDGLYFARPKVEGDLLPWWQQPDGFREGKIKEPPKTFIRSIDEFADKIGSNGHTLVTKDVLKEILNKLMNIKRESVIDNDIEYCVLHNDEVDCYHALILNY